MIFYKQKHYGNFWGCNDAPGFQIINIFILLPAKVILLLFPFGSQSKKLGTKS